MVAATIACAPISAFGFSKTVHLSLSPVLVSSEPEKEPIEEEEGGKHIPPRPVQCTIDATAGIQFVGMEKPEILTFEIYDLSGACVAVFGDEAAFLDFLFAQSGEYQIRLVTAGWAYIGYIGV